MFSEVPQELIREARGGEVNLNMEDHRQENYVKPKMPLKAFTGEGHTLGRYHVLTDPFITIVTVFTTFSHFHMNLAY